MTTVEFLINNCETVDDLKELCNDLSESILGSWYVVEDLRDGNCLIVNEYHSKHFDIGDSYRTKISFRENEESN